MISPHALLVFAVDVLVCGAQGVRAVIAESFEKLHKNQLLGMGIMPLQFLPDQSADSLELNGKEKFTITLPDSLSPRQQFTVKVGNMQLTDELWFNDSQRRFNKIKDALLNFLVTKIQHMLKEAL